MPIRSQYPDVEIPQVSLTEFLFGNGPGSGPGEVHGEYAESPALIDGASGEALTYAELGWMVTRIAAGLHERGIGRGDVVCLFAPNSPQWAAAFHGVLRANAVVTSANSLYTPAELAHQLADSGARMVLTVSPLLETVTEAARKAGLDDGAVLTLDAGAAAHESLGRLLAGTAEPPALETGPDDTAVLPYSSGTTGAAKGVILTHRNLVVNVLQTAAVSVVDPGSRILAVLPFFHIYGMTVMMNLGLHRHCTVVTMPKFDLQEFLRVISEYRVQRINIAPPIAVALAKHPLVDQYDLSCVEIIHSGAAPLDAELGHAVAQRLGCTVLQGYGMTELSPVSHTIPDDRPDIDLNSCGLAIPNVESKLVDTETGAEVGPGERGELWVRGPNVMAGYLNNAQATADTLDADGFLHTGDVATVTDEGVFTVVDRVKELIKYKGYQVPPAELEALLLTHDRVADAAVVGARDANGEEVPKAYVVTQPGAELSADTVLAFVADQVAPHKKVRMVEFLESIPKSSSGKILRKQLREVAG